ncbi:MAG: hypothetical protein RI971_766, partial [Chloroflexota bacterium]
MAGALAAVGVAGRAGAQVGQACASLGDVRVLPFEGLLSEFARAQGARVLVRGIRAVSDYDYEFQMAGMN